VLVKRFENNAQRNVRQQNKRHNDDDIPFVYGVIHRPSTTWAGDSLPRKENQK
jgi:hypothetical protein